MRGIILGGPYSKDYSILGSILGSSYVGKLSICWMLRLANACLPPFYAM